MNKYFLATSRKDSSMRQGEKSKCEEERRDACLDEALGFTFPASDPVAVNCSVIAFLAPKREQFRVSIDFFKQASTAARP